jgi:hypothetical protein
MDNRQAGQGISYGGKRSTRRGTALWSISEKSLIMVIKRWTEQISCQSVRKEGTDEKSRIQKFKFL